MGLLGRAPNVATSGAAIGLVVFTVVYEFSGQRSPAVAVPQPIPVSTGLVQENLEPMSANVSDPQEEL
jgi:hypothetical protein